MDVKKSIAYVIASLVITAAVIGGAILITTSIPAARAFIDRYIIHPSQPLVSGLAAGLFIGIVGVMAFRIHSTLTKWL